MVACSVCHEPAIGDCGRCKQAFYCGAECQQRDWAAHKAHCRSALAQVDTDALLNELSSRDSVLRTAILKLQLEIQAERLAAAGQSHVVRFVPQLSDPERAALVAQLAAVDVADLARVVAAAAAFDNAQKASGAALALAPLPATGLGDREASSPAQVDAWRQAGLQAIAAGQVATLVLAGGQGTRLKFDKPKGLFDVGLPSHKSLFQLQAEKILKLQSLVEKQFGKPAGSVRIPWVIMTSDSTDADTREFFAANANFGLRGEDVLLFMQPQLPCVTPEGKIIMESRSKMATAPDGNGAVYRALHKSGTLGELQRRGVVHVLQYCVDNLLVKMADPVFLGHCIASGSECASKVVRKASPTEAVGVVCLRGGKASVVEYSEIPPDVAAERDETGALRYNAAHICVNYFSVPFLERAALEHFREMWHHIARKVIPCVDEQGVAVVPTQPNGWKLEQFIFDMFSHARTFSAFSTDRATEFAPIKNATGADSPQTARELLSAQNIAWIRAAGGEVVGEGLCEIDSALTYDGEGLESVVAHQKFSLPLHLKAK